MHTLEIRGSKIVHAGIAESSKPMVHKIMSKTNTTCKVGNCSESKHESASDAQQEHHIVLQGAKQRGDSEARGQDGHQGERRDSHGLITRPRDRKGSRGLPQPVMTASGRLTFECTVRVLCLDSQGIKILPHG